MLKLDDGMCGGMKFVLHVLETALSNTAECKRLVVHRFFLLIFEVDDFVFLRICETC